MAEPFSSSRALISFSSSPSLHRPVSTLDSKFRHCSFLPTVSFRKKGSFPVTDRVTLQAVACQNATSSIKSANELIESLINGVDLSDTEAESCLDYMLIEGSEALISAFLVLLRAKGETFEEVVGLARAMIKRARKVEGLVDAVDIVGTGGDGANTVNISTGASILAAACGAKVAKQGNRSSSSACGSADVLEALGIVIDLGPEDKRSGRLLEGRAIQFFIYINVPLCFSLNSYRNWYKKM